MYCQTCGTEIQTGLNYCNRCGAMVNTSLTTRQETALVDIKSPVRTLGATVALTTLVGLVIIFMALDVFGTRGFPPELLGMIGAAGFFLILVIDVLLIRILSRIVQLPVAAQTIQTQPKRQEPRELHAPQQAQTYMPASTDPLPVSSVTDHTTRTFHPVYKEPRAKS
ncbi:MAG TPA: zinc ribbon domain-containing protein [Pyrinomonadaceae bacterium]|nr:zinc ribbon domain-containing protein [Pyrinomonadaceae bacterium]